MRKTFPDQFGYDACLEKNWFWTPTDWTLSLEAAELSVGRGSLVEPFAGFSTKTEYYQHFLCISKREVDDQEWSLTWVVCNSDTRKQTRMEFFHGYTRRICERAAALLMSCISEETFSNEDHLDSLEERITEKCEEWSTSEYKVLSGRELSWYQQAKEERKRQKISEDHTEALEEKEKREAMWEKERSKIHGEARKKHIHKKALEEWEQEKWSRNVVNELDKTTDEPCEVAVVTDQEYLDQLIEEYVTGELSLSQFEYKLEDIIGLQDVTSEGAIQTGSTSFIETVF